MVYCTIRTDSVTGKRYGDIYIETDSYQTAMEIANKFNLILDGELIETEIWIERPPSQNPGRY